MLPRTTGMTLARPQEISFFARGRRLAGLIGMLGAAACGRRAAPPAPAPAPLPAGNILLITVDALRADHPPRMAMETDVAGDRPPGRPGVRFDEAGAMAEDDALFRLDVHRQLLEGQPHRAQGGHPAPCRYETMAEALKRRGRELRRGLEQRHGERPLLRPGLRLLRPDLEAAAWRQRSRMIPVPTPTAPRR